MRADYGHWALLLTLNDALTLQVFKHTDLQFLVCHADSQAFVWVAHRWPGLPPFVYQKPEYKPPTPLHEESLMSLALHTS